jgi:hypothetical protein
MPEQPAPSGIDAARVALAAARAAAKQRPTGPARKKPAPARSTRRGFGRDPISVMAAVQQMLADRGYEVPAAGGSIIDRWPDIAPELAGKVAAVGFDPETGCLSLRPATAAYGAQLRLSQRQLVARITEKAGSAAVRSLRILPPAAVPGPANTPLGSGMTTPHPGTSVGPEPKTRAAASSGLRTAQEHLAALRARAQQEAERVAQPSNTPVLREPENVFADAIALTQDTPTDIAPAEDSRARAIARARAEKAGHRVAETGGYARTA